MARRKSNNASYAARLVIFGVFCTVAFFTLRQTGDQQTDDASFLQRTNPSAIRVMTFNVDSGYPKDKYLESDRFRRVIAAVTPDIVMLQEIGNKHSADYLQTLFDEAIPLENRQHWHAYRADGGVIATAIVSRFPLTLTRDAITPPARPNARITLALVDLPNGEYASDLYVASTHFKAKGGSENEQKRQAEADAVVNWLRDARTVGGAIDLACNTPFIIAGDLNPVDGPAIIQTLTSGDIANNAIYGPDFAPDWDDTAITDVHPTHNAAGKRDFTWHKAGSRFPPSRLDYIIYSDSVMNVAKSFILNTATITDDELQSVGLEQYDIAEKEGVFDHLPVVADFLLD